MPVRSSSAAADLRAALDLGAVAGIDDAALLDLFERRVGEPAAERAFEAIVARHGPLVLRVARLRLDSEEDARDAFQATFWLLARRSRSIRNRAGLAGWLGGVASRVAARARVDAARRRAREARAARPVLDPTPDPARHQPHQHHALRAEVDRLPAPYRLAVILADLEGLSGDEAAARLGCPVGTFKARLSRARARLRPRLAARGLAPLGAPAPRRPLVVPFPLVQAARRLALLAPPLGRAAALAPAVTLAQGASRTMFLTAVPAWAAAVTLALAATVGTAVVQSSGSGSGQDPATTAPPAPPARPGPARPRPPAPIDPPAPGAAVPPPYRQAFERALAAAEATPDRSMRVENLVGVARALTRQGDHAGARATLTRALAEIAAGKPTDDWVHPLPILRVAQAQAENGDREDMHRSFERAASIVEAMPALYRSTELINMIPAQQRLEGRTASRPLLDAAGRLIDLNPEMMFSGSHGWTGRVELLAQEGNFAAALEQCRQPPGFPGETPADVGAKAAVGVAKALLPSDPPGFVADILDQAQRLVLDRPASISRTSNLFDLMDVLIRLGRFDAADELAHHFEPVVAGNILGNSNGFNQAMRYAELAEAEQKAGDPARAIRSAHEAIRVIRGLGDNISIQAFPFTKAVTVLVTTGAAQEALDIARSLPAGAVMADAVASLILQMKRQGQAAEAERWADWASIQLRASLASARATDPPNDAWAASIEGALTRLERIKAGQPLTVAAIETMPAADRPAAWQELARDWAGRGRVADALALAQQAGDPALRRAIELAVAFGLPAAPAQPLSDAAR